MGAIAYGRRLRQDASAVAYTFGLDPDEPDGIVVIPLDDPGSWYVEDAADRPLAAEHVVIKAYRLHRTTGAWPEIASFFS
jgi:hypothetical protein